MGVKVLRRTIGVFSGRGLIKEKVKNFLNLLGGLLFMEQVNRKNYEISKSKEKNDVLEKIIIQIKERSRIFYNKYLRTTVHYDQTEMKNAKMNNLESVMMEFIKRQ